MSNEIVRRVRTGEVFSLVGNALLRGVRRAAASVSNPGALSGLARQTGSLRATRSTQRASPDEIYRQQKQAYKAALGLHKTKNKSLRDFYNAFYCARFEDLSTRKSWNHKFVAKAEDEILYKALEFFCMPTIQAEHKSIDLGLNDPKAAKSKAQAELKKTLIEIERAKNRITELEAEERQGTPKLKKKVNSAISKVISDLRASTDSFPFDEANAKLRFLNTCVEYNQAIIKSVEEGLNPKNQAELEVLYTQSRMDRYDMLLAAAVEAKDETDLARRVNDIKPQLISARAAYYLASARKLLVKSPSGH